ncbi:MAG: hypothetical protein IKY72_06130 [Bacteroidaceae bacterium]|nr:hypothetical protein [Bacteroidaceae bacterium]
MKIRALILGILFSMGGVAAMSAQDQEVVKGFSGGMMVHSGYQYGCDNPFGLNISSPTFGIGGCAKLHFSEHFRAGFEGYFSTAPIKRGVVSGSHNKLFWTGLLADWFFQRGKFIPYVGATLGGGMETSFFMFEGDKHDWVEEGRTVLHKQPFFAIDPYVGVEYAVGKALRLTLKADWLFALNADGLNEPMGPRVYFGFIFAH